MRRPFARAKFFLALWFGGSTLAVDRWTGWFSDMPMAVILWAAIVGLILGSHFEVQDGPP